MFLLPLRHENMQGRRWPVVTFALIAINVIAFLGTHWIIEAQDAQIPERVEVVKHLVLLAATHPELKMGDDARKFVRPLEAQNPDDWKQLASPSRKPDDDWEARIRQVEDPTELQAEMDGISQKFPGHPAQHIFSSLCLCASSSDCHLLLNLQFPSRRLAAPDRQHVVSVACRLHPGRQLGPRHLRDLLPACRRGSGSRFMVGSIRTALCPCSVRRARWRL